MSVRMKTLIAALVLGQLSLVAVTAAPAIAAGEGTISGVVTSGTTPAPNFTENATVVVADATTQAAIATTTSATDGSYSIAGLDLGTYVVYSIAPGNQSKFWVGSGFSTPSAPTPIELTLGAPTRTDIDIDFPTGGFGGTFPGASDGFSSATVTFTNTDTQPGYSETVGLVGDQFGLGYIPAGTYQVRLNYQSGRSYTFPTLYSTAVTNGSMSVPAPNTITGTVSSPGGALAGARVTAYNNMGMQAASTTTDTNGVYVFNGLRDGSYRIGATPPGQTGTRYNGGSTNQYNAPFLNVNAGTNPLTVGIDIVFAGGGFSGRLSSGPTALANTRVSFVTTGAVMNPTNESATTDANGDFVIRYLPAGTYNASYLDPITYMTTQLGGTYSTNGTSITPITLNVPTGSITGTVYSGGQPFNGTANMAQAWLEPVGMGNSRAVQVSNTGTYTFTGVSDGQYYVSFSSMGSMARTYHPSAANQAGATIVTIGDADRTLEFVDITLPNNRITGRVTAGANDIANASVGVYLQNYMAVASGSTGADGRFDVGGLPAGAFRVRVTPPGGGEIWYGGTSYDNATVVDVNSANSPRDVAIALPTGVIEGRILDNGVPVNGMTTMYQVTLENVQSTGMMSMSPASTQLQANGTFRFNYVPDGTYRIRYSTFFPTSKSGYFPNGVTQSAAATRTINSTAQLIDDVEINLPNGTLAGSVTRGGTAITPSGYTQVNLNEPTGASVRSTQLSPTGTYSFTGVADGDYVVSYMEMSPYRQTYHLGATSLADATRITLGNTNRALTGIDIQLPDGTISGRVTLAGTTTGVATSRVNVTSGQTPGTQVVGTTTTNSNGDFTVSGVPNGSFKVSTRPTFSAIEVWYGGTNATTATPVVLTTTDNDAIGVSISIPAGRISGTVTRGGSPVSPTDNVQVYLQPILGGGNAAFTTAGTNGRYEFTNVPNGKYRVSFGSFSFGGTGYAPGVETSAEARVVDVSSTTLVIADADIVLPNGRITGVITRGGQPWTPGTNAYVTVTKATASGLSSGFSPNFQVNSNGMYTIGQLFPGSYLVRVDSNSFNSTIPGFHAFHPGVGSRLDADLVVVGVDALVPNVNIDVPAGSISGTLRQGGIGVDGVARSIDAVVSDASNDTNRRVRVSANGTYTVGALDRGDYVVSYVDTRAGATRYWPNTLTPRSATAITLDAATPSRASIDFDLLPIGSIAGTVTTTSGSAVNTTVTLEASQTGNLMSSSLRSQPTGAGGAYRFDGVVEGNYVVRVDQQPNGSPIPVGESTIWAPGVLERDRRAITTVTGGATATSNIVIPDRAIITGRVADPADLGVGGVKVYRVDSLGYYQPQRTLIATTEPDGTYESTPFLPRTTRIEFVPPAATGFSTAYHGGSLRLGGATVLDPQSGQTLTGINGVVGLPGTLSGTITTPGGQPARASVQLFAVGETPQNYSAGASLIRETADGTYSFDNVPAGNWIVIASSNGANMQTLNGTFATTYSGNTLRFTNATPVTVPRGGTATSIIQLQAGQTIRGRVTGPDGEAITGVNVGMNPILEPTTPFGTFRSVYTGPDGRYEIRGVTPGDVKLQFSVGGQPLYVGEYYPSGTTFDNATPFTIPSTGPVPDANVELARTITGSATLVDSSGTPVAPNLPGLLNFRVLACLDPAVPATTYGCSDNSSFGVNSQRDDNGTYRFVGLPPGRFNIGAATNGFPATSLASVNIAAGETFHCTIGVLGGQSTCAIVPPGPSGTVSGTVNGPNGQPIAGVNVGLHVARNIPIAGAITRADGTYTITAVPVGTYRVLFAEPYSGGAGQVSLAEWFDPSGTLYQGNDFVVAEQAYLEADLIAVTNGGTVDADANLERYVAGAATVTGGPIPAANTTYAILCPAPGRPQSGTFGCIDPGTGMSVSYPRQLTRDGNAFTGDFLTPGTFNVALVEFVQTGFSMNLLSDIATVTVAASERFDCTLALTGTGTSSCTASPFFVVEDADGIPAAVEAGAPNGGDGNNDGSDDASQPEVASLVDPSIVAPTNGSNYITLVSKTDVPGTLDPAPLTSVALTATPANLPPPTAVVQTGLISFKADFTNPVTGLPPATPVTGVFEIFLPSQANQYWKYDAGTWTDATSLVAFDQNPTVINEIVRWRAVIRITDGGFGDADGVANGIIDDPAVFTLDTTPPTITCPTTKSYLLNQTGASVNATVADTGSGVLMSTIPLTTDSVGSFDRVLTASDRVGNAAPTKTCSYTVGYRFEGFRPPISASATVVNEVKAGSNVPVKWRITDANGVGVAVTTSFRGLGLRRTSCDLNVRLDTMEPWELSTASGLKYLGNGEWQFNWKSSKSTMPGCYDLELLLADSTKPVVAKVLLR